MWPKIGEATLSILQALCPKSRWGNAVYFVVGVAIANGDNIISFVNHLLSLLR